jgi:hypothetical protein
MLVEKLTLTLRHFCRDTVADDNQQTAITHMEIIRGLPLPTRNRPRVHYDFDKLKHGDAIRVSSVSGARTMFARWRERHPDRHVQLVRHDDPAHSDILFFVETTRPELRAVRRAADVI